MANVKITLTEDEAYELLSLVKESSNTGNEEWDEKMKSIEQKIDKEVD